MNLFLDGILDINEKQVYYAIKDEGAFTYNLAIPYFQSYITKILPKDKELGQSVIATDFQYSTEEFNITQKIISSYYFSDCVLKITGPASLDILKNGLGEKYAISTYNDLYFNTQVRVWDVAAALCIVRELGCKAINLKDGKEITTQMLKNSEEKIAIAVSYSDKLLMDIYNRYLSVINNSKDTFTKIMLKRKEEKEDILKDEKNE